MAKWDLPQYQSVYRDLGSVAVNTELRKRYVQNFAASDALSGAVGDMDALDFEGDQAAKERLSGKYNAELDLMSAQGDYEHMGRKVSTLARGFIKDYKPVQTNQNKYNSYIASLDEARKLGIDKGGLDETDYMGLKAKARHGYAGLQYNEDGVLDEDSYFAGQGHVKSVDLNALVNEQLKNIKPNSWKNLGTDIAVQKLQLTKDGNIDLNQEIGENGQIKYWVTTKGGKEYVDSQRIKNIVEGIIYDPNVQLGIDQKVDVLSFDKSPEDASNEAETILDEIDTKIEEVLASTEINDKEKDRLVNILEENKETLLLKQANEGDLSVVKANIKAELEANAKALAIGTHAFSEEEYGQTIRWDEAALHNTKKNIDESTIQLAVIMEADSLPGLGGASAESKRKFIGDTDMSITADLDILRNGLEKTTGEVINNDQLLDRLLDIDNAEQYTELAESYNMGTTKFKQTVNTILINKTKRDLVKQKINEVEASLVEQGKILTEKEIIEKFRKEVITNDKGKGGAGTTVFNRTGGVLSGLDLKNAMIEAGLLDTNATTKDAMEYWQIGLGTVNENDALQPKHENFMNILHENMKETFKPEFYSDKINERSSGEKDDSKRLTMSNIIRSFKSKYTNLVSKRDALANDEYSKETKTDSWHMPNFAPNKSHINNKQTKEALAGLFEGTFPPGITFINPDGGADLSLDQYFDESSWWGEWNTDNLEIQHKKIGLSSISRADGTSVLVIPVKDKRTGKTRNALVRSTAVKTGGYLESWTNSAEYQMHSLFAEGEHAQVKTFAPEIFDNVIFDYKHPTGPSVIINGKVHSKDEGLQMLANTYASKGFANSFEDLYNNQ